MKKHLAFVVALALGLLALAALARGMTGWAQGPEGDTPATPWASSADPPEGIERVSPSDRPAGVEAEDIEAAATYNASLRITGSALRPRTSNVEWTSVITGGCIYASLDNASTVFNTPVYLPQGATVKFLRMYFHDTNASANAFAWFTAYDIYGDIAAEWSVSSTGSAGNGYVTSSEFTHTVNYENYSYLVNWLPNDLGSDMQLCGFRIYYQTPPGYSYLPLAVKEY